MSMGKSVREVVAEYAKLSKGDGDAHKSPMKPAWVKTTLSIDDTRADALSMAATSRREPWVDTTPTQIDLLQRAIGLLKTHATEAGTNLVRLKSLMTAEERLEPEQLESLQRERWLEERRELEATKALWTTCQCTEAITADDYELFQHRREAEERKRHWHQAQEDAERKDYRSTLVPDEGNEGRFYPLARRRRQLQLEESQITRPEPQSQLLIPTTDHAIPPGEMLIPLTLACKADPEALVPKRAYTSPLDESEEEEGFDFDDGTNFVRGTVTIFRLNGPGGRHKSRKPSTSSTFRRMAEEQVGHVTMPDYVADLLTEFDGQTAVPTLSLLSSPPSLPEQGLSHFTSPPTLKTELPRSPSPPPSITSPKSAPTSPVRSRRGLKRMPSAKRISGFFHKRPSMSALRQSESPYPLHATQIPSRLGSSIDLVIHEETPFGLSLDIDTIGRKSGTFASPTLSQGNWGNSPISPSGLNPHRFSDSAAAANSMVSLMSSQETSTSGSASVAPPPALNSAPAASSLSLEHSQDTPAASMTPVAQPPSSPETRRFAERLKKRMSALRF